MAQVPAVRASAGGAAGAMPPGASRGAAAAGKKRPREAPAEEKEVKVEKGGRQSKGRKKEDQKEEDVKEGKVKEEKFNAKKKGPQKVREDDVEEGEVKEETVGAKKAVLPFSHRPPPPPPQSLTLKQAVSAVFGHYDRCADKDKGVGGSGGGFDYLELTARPGFEALASHIRDVHEKLKVRLSAGFDIAGCPDLLVCRNAQVNQVNDFVWALASRQASKDACMYISGIPGTGKTTAVNHAIKLACNAYNDNKKKYTISELGNFDRRRDEGNFELCFINGTQLESPTETWVYIWDHLRKCTQTWKDSGARQYHKGYDKDGGLPKTGSRCLQMVSDLIRKEGDYWTQKEDGMLDEDAEPPIAVPLLIVLDEMDRAVGRHARSIGRENMLFDLLDKCRQTKKIALIGIANRQNMVEFAKNNKRADRLVSRTERFDRVVFAEYGSGDLKKILIARAGSLHVSTPLDGNAIGQPGAAVTIVTDSESWKDVVQGEQVFNYIGMVVAKHHGGDCRKALELCGHVLVSKIDELAQLLEAYRSVQDTEGNIQSIPIRTFHASLLSIFNDKAYTLRLDDVQLQMTSHFTSWWKKIPWTFTAQELVGMAAFVIEVTRISIDERMARRDAVGQRIVKMLRLLRKDAPPRPMHIARCGLRGVVGGTPMPAPQNDLLRSELCDEETAHNIINSLMEIGILAPGYEATHAATHVQFADKLAPGVAINARALIRAIHAGAKERPDELRSLRDGHNAKLDDFCRREREVVKQQGEGISITDHGHEVAQTEQ